MGYRGGGPLVHSTHCGVGGQLALGRSWAGEVCAHTCSGARLPVPSVHACSCPRLPGCQAAQPRMPWVGLSRLYGLRSRPTAEAPSTQCWGLHGPAWTGSLVSRASLQNPWGLGEPWQTGTLGRCQWRPLQAGGGLITLILSRPDPDNPLLGPFALALPTHLPGTAGERGLREQSPSVSLHGLRPGALQLLPRQRTRGLLFFLNLLCGVCVFLPITTAFHLKRYLPPPILRAPAGGEGRPSPHPM